MAIQEKVSVLRHMEILHLCPAFYSPYLTRNLWILYICPTWHFGKLYPFIWPNTAKLLIFSAEDYFGASMTWNVTAPKGRHPSNTLSADPYRVTESSLQTIRGFNKQISEYEVKPLILGGNDAMASHTGELAGPFRGISPGWDVYTKYDSVPWN